MTANTMIAVIRCNSKNTHIDTVETWIGFLNSDETGAAGGVYTGSIVL
jgi:hypothetical protein